MSFAQFYAANHIRLYKNYKQRQYDRTQTFAWYCEMAWVREAS